MSSPTAPRALSPARSALISVLFWTLLLVAAFLYGGVALAPKLVAWQEWDRQCRENQWELISLESRSTQLEQVVAALQDDPHFAAELIRQEFNARVPGEEVIPVSDGLAFRPPQEVAVSPLPPPTARWDQWLILLATHQPLRHGLLAVAAGMVILGFTFLHDHGGSTERRSVLQSLRDRYAAK